MMLGEREQHQPCLAIKPRGWKFRFNYLNLVEEIRLNGSVAARYKYLADGTKLEVSDPLGSGYLYFGSLIYSKRGNSYEPESMGFAGGRIVFTSSGCDLQYHVIDNLGSVRAIADRDGKLLEKIDYYPFGKRIETAQQSITGNRHLFNGKEWQATGRVNLLDYGARMYDPQMGRWIVQDPKYQTSNPYTFCGSDPINRIDPNGMDYYFNEDGDFLFQDYFPTDFIRIVPNDYNDFLSPFLSVGGISFQAYTSFFSWVGLSNEAIEKIYSWVFTTFFPDLANIPLSLAFNKEKGVLMSTDAFFIKGTDILHHVELTVNHTENGMLTYLGNGAIADHLNCILNLFDHEGDHINGWLKDAKGYRSLPNAKQEVQAYQYQIEKSVYWDKVPTRFKIMIKESYNKYLEKL